MECSQIGGGNIIAQTINLSEITVETTTQAATSAPAPVVVQPPAQSSSSSSSSTGYTCQGRSMSQTAALMTASEKAIVNDPSSSRELVNEQYAKHGYCFQKSYWHTYFYG
ncbi:MAG: hypothetical protein LUD77_00455, partial [Clostridiales bacterium]|nr:hypothetical protein [Clostridiales bacterium]